MHGLQRMWRNRDDSNGGAPPNRTAVPVVFLLVGAGRGYKPLERAVKHLALGSTLPLDIHIVTDRTRVDMPKSWQQHLTSALPADASAAYQRYRALTHGPGAMYMYKPFLYHLLPRSLSRVLVLDSDLYVTRAGDLARLYDEFDRFPASAVLGLANEQQPTYYHGSTGGRASGTNGGVQLHHLARMRLASGRHSPGALYEREIERCASGACGRIGYLGDQTFYTALRNSTPSLVHRLSCGWNRQLSTHYWSSKAKVAREAHVCEAPCRLVHGNFYPTGKRLVGRLQTITTRASRPMCEQCMHEAEAVYDRKTSAGAHMMSVLKECCCGRT